MDNLDQEAMDAEWQRVLTEDELETRLRDARRDAVHLKKTSTCQGAGAPGCWFGGKPQLPENIPWPVFQSIEGYALPMQFFAQLNLAAMPLLDNVPELPRSGSLFFFVDLVLGDLNGWQPGSSKVIYVTQEVGDLPEREMPCLPDLSGLDEHPDEIWWHSQEPDEIQSEMPQGYFRKWPLTLDTVRFIDRYQHRNRSFQDAAVKIEDQDFLRINRPIARNPWVSQGENRPLQPATHMMFDTLKLHYQDRISLLVLDDDGDLGMSFYRNPIRFEIERSDLAAGDFENAIVSDRGV